VRPHRSHDSGHALPGRSHFGKCDRPRCGLGQFYDRSVGVPLGALHRPRDRARRQMGALGMRRLRPYDHTLESVIRPRIRWVAGCCGGLKGVQAAISSLIERALGAAAQDIGFNPSVCGPMSKAGRLTGCAQARRDGEAKGTFGERVMRVGGAGGRVAAVRSHFPKCDPASG
jgi:hypothetical protein